MGLTPHPVLLRFRGLHGGAVLAVDGFGDFAVLVFVETDRSLYDTPFEFGGGFGINLKSARGAGTKISFSFKRS